MRAGWNFHCVAALALATASGVCAPQSGELEVREGKTGVPCFTVSQAEELRGGAPDFQSISVSESGSTARTLMWSMAMPKERTFAVSFRMCIPYAGRWPVLPQTPAAPLQAGRAYEVTLQARAAQGAFARLYRARFCLVAHGAGQLRVRTLGPARVESTTRPACAP